jgi:uncharacterized lipoprotein YajG
MTPVERFHHVRKESEMILRRFMLLSALILAIAMLLIFVCANADGTIDTKPAIALVLGPLIAQVGNAVFAWISVDRI